MIKWLWGWMLKVISAIKPFMLAVFDRAVQEAIAKLKDIALKIIAELATTNITNEEKRREVFNGIKAYAIKEGIEARDSVINLVIEMTVNKLKNEGIL